MVIVAEKLNIRATWPQSRTGIAIFLYWVTLKMLELQSFGKSGTTRPTTQHHIQSVTTTNVTTQSNKNYRILTHPVHIKCDVSWNWKVWHSISNCDSSKVWEDMTGGPMSVRRLSLTQCHMIMITICLMELEHCYISTPHTSLIKWKVFVHQAGNPIRSTLQAVSHGHTNLLGTIGSRIWVKVRKLEFIFHKHDWSLWRWQQA